MGASGGTDVPGGTASPSGKKDCHHRQEQAPRTDEEEEEGESSSASAAVVLAGLTRSLVFALKGSLPKGIAKTVLRKKAFLAIGQRTATATTLVEQVVATETSATAAIAAKSQSSSSSSSPMKAKVVPIGSSYLRLFKNGLLGMAVFGVYDTLIFRIWPQQHHDSSQPRNTMDDGSGRPTNTHPPVLTADLKLVWMQAAVSPNGEKTPLWAHFGAGALAGVAQSVIMDMWEIVSYWWHHRHRVLNAQQHFQRINFHFILRRLVHHSIGYSTLFGCYEWIRRSLVHTVYDYFSSGSPSVPQTLYLLERYKLIANENGCYNMTFVPMATAFMAGGVAGQLHYISSHYTQQWKLSSLLPHSPKVTEKHPHPQQRRHLPKPPKLRPMAAAFLPTALCFLAFQYGGELTEKILEEDDTRHPFPVYIHSPHSS